MYMCVHAPDALVRVRQGRLLEELPRELCEYLKVSAVVRSAAAALGGTIYDRLRINAVYALKVPSAFSRAAAPVPAVQQRGSRREACRALPRTWYVLGEERH